MAKAVDAHPRLDKYLGDPRLSADQRFGPRYELLWRVYEDVLEFAGDNGVEEVTLNPEVLVQIIVSYFDDIDRLKKYHGIKFVDPPKQAAFTVKWIIKRKPITWLVGESINTTEYHHLLNEVLALRSAFSFIDISSNILSEDFIVSLLYSLHNREIDGYSWLPLFDLLWRIGKQEPNLRQPL